MRERERGGREGGGRGRERGGEGEGGGGREEGDIGRSTFMHTHVHSCRGLVNKQGYQCVSKLTNHVHLCTFFYPCFLYLFVSV